MDLMSYRVRCVVATDFQDRFPTELDLGKFTYVCSNRRSRQDLQIVRGYLTLEYGGNTGAPPCFPKA